MPPNTCLPTTMANVPPTAPIHHGAHGGSDMASNTPVSKAEPSLRNGRNGWPANRKQAASASRQAKIVTINRFSAGQPNRITPYSSAGATAASTNAIRRGTLSGAWAWGALVGKRVTPPLRS